MNEVDIIRLEQFRQLKKEKSFSIYSCTCHMLEILVKDKYKVIRYEKGKRY